MISSLDEAEFEQDICLSTDNETAASPWVVLKFGGTSVSTLENWRTIAGLLRNRLDAGLRPVVVHSALRTVSNRLDAILRLAVEGDPAEELGTIRQQHEELAVDLGVDSAALIGRELLELEQLIAGIRLVREVSVRVRVRVMALGEIMAT
ncbi:MAG: hypothetical protein OEV69_10225, partial [Gammaproteobacteria bacterium]|nr:hypothetical protein [Gammaproteobacteria bacterium]